MIRLLPFRFLLRLVMVFIIAGVIGGYHQFVRHIQQSQAIDSMADGIVVLTGGTNRLERGLDLFATQKAKYMLISGVHPDVRDSWLQKNMAGRSLPTCCIAIGREAVDTVGNAIETGRWLHANNLKRLHIVTSAYHMPRALLEFRRHLPDDIILVPQPVFTDRVRLENWWKPTGSSLLLLTEFGKFTVGSLRFALMGKAPIAPGILPAPYKQSRP